LPFCDGVGIIPAEAIKNLKYNKRVEKYSQVSKMVSLFRSLKNQSRSLNVVKKDLPGKRKSTEIIPE
jgi:hypothetical protein